MSTNRIIRILTILSVSFCLAQGQSQTKHTDADYAAYPHWMTMMQDPQGNFYETQKAFNLYWKDRKIPQEGSGYSLFKRWEYLWRSSVNPDGSYPEPDHVYKEYNKYAGSHPQDGRLKTGAGAWRELGPKSRFAESNYNSGLGRLNAIAFHPTDTATIYAGAPTSGFWITRNGGRNWITSTDNQPICGVSAILVDPVNPEVILIGTGDRDHGLSFNGMGVFRSIDGGLSWEPFNKGMGNVNVGMFARSAGDPRIILAAANSGIFKTVDGGENWVKTSPHSANFTDIKFKPGSSTIAYATSPRGFYRSENAGDTWSLVPANSGYLVGTRMVIGVTPANDSLVYLISGQEFPDKFLGCFLSRDFGRSFTLQGSSPNILGVLSDGSDATNQASYDLCVQVDSRNPMVLLVGGIYIWKSIDGGKSWAYNLFPSPIHCDQHALVANPLNNRLYVGNDGGIYHSDNGGTNWINISKGLGIGQIYKIGVNPSAPDNVLAGFQDNMSAEWNGKYWATLGYQDGTECAVDPVDSKYRYVSSIYGLIYRVYNSITTKIAGLDINGISENGGDLSPFLLSEGDTKTMVIGCNNIWISHTVRNNGGVSWRKISDNLAGSNYYYVMVMEQSPADTNVLYFTREDGKLFRTDNLLDASEVKWTLLPNSLPLTISEGIQPYVDIECHPYDANTVYLVNYKKVYKSIDKGLTLEDITGSLPDIPLTTIVYDKTSNEGLYLGSDAGVYYKDADMPDWILYGQSLPVSVKVTELEISYDSVNRQNSRLYASTFGRGVWETGLAEINPVPPPKQLIASATGESVDLTWIAPFTKQIISSYRIYRNDISLATTNNLNYTDQTVQKDVTYYYKVTALYQTGAESGFSNEVFATVITPVVLPYIQLFENGTAGWTAKYTLDGWKYGTSDELGITGRDGHFFGINSYEAGPGIHVTDCLRTPEINLSLYQGKTVTLNFAYTMQREINYDKFSVIYRQAPDSAWITLKSLEPTDYFDWVWDITELKLPEKALTPHAQIGFLYDDSNQVGWGAAVDDVKIFAGSSNVNQVDKSTSVRIFPNPTKGLVTLELNTLLPDEVNLKVYSFIGQVVLEKTISCQTGITTETIDLSSQPQGIYMLSLKSKSGSWQQKNTIILYPENVRRK